MRLGSSSLIRWVECIALLRRRVLQLLVFLGLRRLLSREARCAAVGSYRCTAQTQKCRLLASLPLCGQETAGSGQTGSMALALALALVQVDMAGGLGCKCKCRCRCRVLASEVSDMGS
jgi:hypothetical protein